MHETKYTIDGQLVKVLSEINGGYVVCPMFETEDEYGCTREHSDKQNFFFVEKVFETPPTKMYNESIIKLKDQINKLTEHKKFLEANIKLKEEEYTKINKLWSKYSELRKLNLYIEGKITHFVRIPDYYYPSIHTFNKDDKEALCEGDRYYNKNILKLVSLFGKSGGDLQYKINQYSDGSGSYINIIPCQSYEEAQVEVVRWYVDKVKDKDYKITLEFVKRAREVGVIVPESEVIRLQDLAKKNIMKNIEEIRLKLEKEEEKLDNL